MRLFGPLRNVSADTGELVHKVFCMTCIGLTRSCVQGHKTNAKRSNLHHLAPDLLHRENVSQTNRFVQHLTFSCAEVAVLSLQVTSRLWRPEDRWERGSSTASGRELAVPV